MVPLCLKFGAIPTYIIILGYPTYKLQHFEKNGTGHFSLIGRHLETVSRTIPVFKHALAPSEIWPTQEISVRFGHFVSSYRVNIARCNLCARAKVKGHIKLKIEENTSMG